MFDRACVLELKGVASPCVRRAWSHILARCYVVVPQHAEYVVTLPYSISFIATLCMLTHLTLRTIHYADLYADLANPKTNWNKTPGYTEAETSSFARVLNSESGDDHDPEAGKFVDVWRKRHPELRHYTYFSYRFNCREKGLGWRLDMCAYTLLPHAGDSWILAANVGQVTSPLESSPYRYRTCGLSMVDR